MRHVAALEQPLGEQLADEIGEDDDADRSPE